MNTYSTKLKGTKVAPADSPVDHVRFVSKIVKERDQQGNSVIQGSNGAQYRITSKKSLLASGSLCKIKLCKNIAEGVDTYLAIKRFSKLTLRKHKQYIRKADGNGMQVFTQLDAVRKEIDIMRHINHPSCIKLYEVIEDVPAKDDDGNDLSDDNLSEKLYLIMELAKYKEVMSWNTSTYKFEANPVFNTPFIPEAAIRKILSDCVQGLGYLHNQAKIVHRDIKP
jgi:serine/threonine protein kinase